MTINLIFKIAAVGILVSILCQVLKHSGREEQAFLTSLAGLLLVLFWIVPYIYDLFESIRDLFSLMSSVRLLREICRFEILSVIDVEMGDVYEYAAGCSTGSGGCTSGGAV